MKLIILRGLPGTGKSTLADKLGKQAGYEVLHVDAFKLSALSELQGIPKAMALREARKRAYLETMQNLYFLYGLKKTGVFVEELFCDRAFVQKVTDFARKPDISFYCFRIERTLDDLMKVEAKRQRAVKNSYHDFLNLEADINDSPVDSEIFIENTSIDQASREILERISD